MKIFWSIIYHKKKDMAKKGKKNANTKVCEGYTEEGFDAGWDFCPEVESPVSSSDPEIPADMEEVEEVVDVVEIPEESPKIKALKGFADLMNGELKYRMMATDSQARQIHSYWQIATGRSDYYVNCSACTIAHIKTLKKLCRNEGIKVM